MENTSQQLQTYSEPTNGTNLVAIVQAAAAAPRIYAAREEELKTTLVNIYAMLGMRADQVPETEEKNLLHNYIRQQLKGYSLPDIKIAFMLFIQNKLDFSEVLYGKFSILFLEKVMQAYKRWKVALPKQAPPQPEQPTQAEVNNIMRQGAIDCFVNYAKTGILIDFGNATYNYLDRIGQLRLTDDRKWKIHHKAIQTLKTQAMENALKAKQTKRLKDVIKQIDEPNSKPVIAQAKRIALTQYFDELIEAGLELKDLIEYE